MSGVKTFIAIMIGVVIVLLFTSVYTVREGQQALLQQLGKLKKDNKGGVVVIEPGLHFKTPIIEKAILFDTRLQTLPIKSSRIMTQEKKYVLADYYVKWRINNLGRYFTRTGGRQEVAAELLAQRLNDSLRAEFGRRTISEVVSDERSEMMAQLLKQADLSTQGLGINVVDVRIKGIDLPSEVSDWVYNRMRAERERVATENRSKGKAAAEAIRANADAFVTVTVAEAFTDAARVRASGDAKAANVYAVAYQKDPDFFAFYRSLNAYQNAFANKNDFLVLRPDSQFFKYFDSVTGSLKHQPETATQQKPAA